MIESTERGSISPGRKYWRAQDALQKREERKGRGPAARVHGAKGRRLGAGNRQEPVRGALHRIRLAGRGSGLAGQAMRRQGDGGSAQASRGAACRAEGGSHDGTGGTASSPTCGREDRWRGASGKSTMCSTTAHHAGTAARDGARALRPGPRHPRAAPGEEKMVFKKAGDHRALPGQGPRDPGRRQGLPHPGLEPTARPVPRRLARGSAGDALPQEVLRRRHAGRRHPVLPALRQRRHRELHRLPKTPVRREAW